MCFPRFGSMVSIVENIVLNIVQFYDCNGIANGDAIEDCLGICNGDAVEDECGICAGDGIPDGECDCDGNVADCAGECTGGAIVDDCEICSGGTTGIEISIPLVLFNWDGKASNIKSAKVCAFMNNGDHTYVSNQVLGGLEGSPNLGEPREVNFRKLGDSR